MTIENKIKNMLWIPQFSTTINGKFNITSDSNWRYCSDMVKGIKKIDKNMHIDVIIPSEYSLVNKNHLKECDADNFISMNMYVHAFAQRFDFNYDNWSQILNKSEYNIIWINDPALVMNIKSVYGVLKKKVPFIVSYNHWPDSPLSPKTPDFMSYYFRQIEGAIFSDIHFVNSEFSKKFLIDGAKKAFKDDIIKSLDKKVYAAFCPIIEEPIPKELKENIVAYTQRLSDLPYYRNAFDNAITIMSKVYEVNKHFKFRIFNHADKPFPVEYKNLPFIEIVNPKNKLEYYKLLGECLMSLDSYVDERVWSISQNEACNLMVMPILKHIDGYKEMYDKSFGGYYKDNDEAVKKIMYGLTHPLWVNREVKEARDFMLTNYNEAEVAQLALNRINDGIKFGTKNNLVSIIDNYKQVLK
jgi:hypothetical protein